MEVVKHLLFAAAFLVCLPSIPSNIVTYVPDHWLHTGVPILLLAASTVISVRSGRSARSSATLRLVILSLFFVILPDYLDVFLGSYGTPY